MLKNEPIIETPFIASDIIAPGSLENESNIYNNIIPIRTWSRGKTLNDVIIFADDSCTDLPSLNGSTMLGYFPVDTIEVDNNKNENDDDNIDNNIKSKSYNDDFDPDDFDRESIPEDIIDKPNSCIPSIVIDESIFHNEDEDYQDDFDQNSFINTNHSPMKGSRVNISLADYSAITSNDNLNMNSLANYLGLDHDADNEIQLDQLKSIPTHASMRSPLLSSHTATPITKNEMANELIQIMKDYDDAIISIESNTKHNNENIINYSNNIIDEQINLTNKSIKINKNKVINTSKPIKSNKPYNINKHRKLHIQTTTDAPVVEPNFHAHIKHKEFLNLLVNKRKVEEENNIIESQKNEARRKKFKETLLEKALKARNTNDNTTVGFLAPTKAFEILSQENNKKKSTNTSNNLMNETEDEKHERIANIRRKFKEKHKYILESLMKKNKEIELKIQQDQQQIVKQKERYRKKLLNILSQDRLEAMESGDKESILECDDTIAVLEHISHQPTNTNEQVDEDSDDVANKSDNEIDRKLDRKLDNNLDCKFDSDVDSTTQSTKKRSKIPVFTHHKQTASVIESIDNNTRRENTAPVEKSTNLTILSPRAAGSALAAIRSNRTNPITTTTTTIIESDIDRHNNEAKRLYNEKMSTYINQLSENRKKEIENKKKLNDRLLRRAAILTNRLINESNERKLMELEDKRAINSKTNNIAKVNNIKRVNKVTNVSEDKTNSVIVQTNSSTDEIKSTNKVLKSKQSDDITTNPSVKLSDEAVDAMVNRLNQPIKGETSTIVTASGSNITTTTIYRDYNDWKKKNNVSPDTPVFCMTGWYPCVKDALLSRGWTFNADSTSPYFDLKWSLRSIDINQENLQPWQLTNHFLKNIALTTKIGLLKSLQSLSWLADSNCNDIIPRGYDLTNQEGIIDFMDDFKYQRAINILKKLFYDITGINRIHSQTDKNIDESLEDNLDNQVDSTNNAQVIIDDRVLDLINVNISDISINVLLFNTCCNVLDRLLKPYDDNDIDTSPSKLKSNQSSLSTNEWDIINNLNIYDSSIALSDEGINSNLSNYLLNSKDKIMKTLTNEHIKRLHEILINVDKYIDSSQGPINGYNNNSQNLWIVKPAAKSRGRGIQTFNNLNKLLKYCDINISNYTTSATQWIVQKYIENPLVICNRKFDMRQWVLVTDWNPLTIYFYNEFYIRISVDEYSTSDLSNSYAHLVNNSIGKNSENFSKVLITEYGHSVEGYMLSFNDFEDYMIKLNNGANVVKDKIHPRMKEIVTWSLMCGSDMIEHRKNSWELYGFDFMIDDNNNTWLIEINSSPACDYSTKITEVYVKKALVELLGVVIDNRKYELLSKKDKQLAPKPDFGGWDCIYKGNSVDKPIGSLGIDISLKGEGLNTKKLNKSLNRSNILKSMSNSTIPVNKSNILDTSITSSANDNEIDDYFDENHIISMKRPITQPNINKTIDNKYNSNIDITSSSIISSDIDDSDDDDMEENIDSYTNNNTTSYNSDIKPVSNANNSHNNNSKKNANSKAIPLKLFTVEF